MFLIPIIPSDSELHNCIKEEADDKELAPIVHIQLMLYISKHRKSMVTNKHWAISSPLQAYPHNMVIGDKVHLF